MACYKEYVLKPSTLKMNIFISVGSPKIELCIDNVLNNVSLISQRNYTKINICHRYLKCRDLRAFIRTEI